MKTRFTKLVLVVLLAVQAVAAQQAPGADFDEYVNKAIKDWGVPGMAIAIVKDDRIVYKKGFGVRELNKPAPVDEHTLFAIGSSSKAFTAASLAMLVDEGKLKWDDPATKHLPGFQLFDPYSTRELTIIDLLSHRSGLARGDRLWYATAYDRNEVLRRVRYLKPSWSLRSRYGYQNIMFLAAGQIIPSITGKSWDDFVRERIFTPLGMKSSNTSIKLFTSPSLALEKYAGTFQSEMYGEAKVALENEKLVIHFGPNFTGDLQHWNYDTFRAIWRDPVQGKGFVNFRLNTQGKVDVVNIEGLSEFTRVPEPAKKALTSAKD